MAYSAQQKADVPHRLSNQPGPSRRGPGKVVRMPGRERPTPDPARLTCTCAEWRAHRVCFPMGDPRRLCKHLVRALPAERQDLPRALRGHCRRLGYLRALARGFPFCRHIRQVRAKGLACELYYPMRPLDPWVEVHAPDGLYGYNPGERRWSMGNRPPWAAEVEASVEAFRRQAAKAARQNPAPAPVCQYAAAPDPDPPLRVRPMFAPTAVFLYVFLAVMLVFGTGRGDHDQASAEVQMLRPMEVCETVGGALATMARGDLDLLLDTAGRDNDRILSLYDQGRIVVLPDKAVVAAYLTGPFADRAKIRYPHSDRELWTTRDAVRCRPATEVRVAVHRP